MATLEIAVNPSFASQLLSVILDGIRYRLRFYFNFRQTIWYMDILNDNDEDVLLGRKLVPDWGITEQFTLDELPPGEFEAFDTSGQGLPPGRDDFGKDQRVRMLYIEATT